MEVKWALDAFLRVPSQATYLQLKNELEIFSCASSMKIISGQFLRPLVLKLDALSNNSQDLRTYCLECMSLLISKIYLMETTALPTLLVIILKQINKKWYTNVIEKDENISEELKLASVQCIIISLKRSASDVLQQFYVKENAMIIGQILVLLMEFIEKEKYKALIKASLECVMTVFYVHDEADKNDVVLRNQLADTLFIFLPKIITILHKIALGDDKLSDDIKQMCIKILGRILHVTFDDHYIITQNERHCNNHDAESFNMLLKSYIKQKEKIDMKKDVENVVQYESRKEKLEQLKQLHNTGRTQDWLNAFCIKLQQIFSRLAVLRSNISTTIRQEYAAMHCLLATKCCYNLKRNFLIILENVIALTEDVDPHIRDACKECLKQLNLKHYTELKQLYEQNAEQLLEKHLTNFPRIICQCDSKDQYAEILFLKGFLNSLPYGKLASLLTISSNIEGLLRCILMATKLSISSDLLNKAHNVHHTKECEKYYSMSKPWRKFRNISCNRCIDQLISLCQILGKIQTVNQLFYDYLIELYNQDDQKSELAINKSEIILVTLWLSTAPSDSDLKINLVNRLLELLLKDENWFLLIEPDDDLSRLKTNKPIKYSTDCTPGLYESATQIRIQDVNDSDDDPDGEDFHRVNWIEAHLNVLHICIVLDALGHCALYLGAQFDTYVFRSLYKVMLKLADMNVMIRQAAYFTLICIQNALKYSNYENLIESHIDYIECNLNNMLKKDIDIESIINVLAVVTKLSSRGSISYFEHSFLTIFEHCTKLNQLQYITSYLRLFNHFLQAFSKWAQSIDSMNVSTELFGNKEKHVEHVNEMVILSNWVKGLMRDGGDNLHEHNVLIPENDANIVSKIDNEEISKDDLPQHIALIKDILYHLITLLSSNDTMHTILCLESLICGLPLLKQYENTFFPLVHSLWKPFVKKLYQNDIITLNCCFKLLLCLANTATGFITKRCLDDVIPFIKAFLKQPVAGTPRLIKNLSCLTKQEIKLHTEMLEELSTMIVNLDIDGKNLNDITEIILLYLNKQHPKKLQNAAVSYFTKLRIYNSPMIYVMLLKKVTEKEYKLNCEKLLNELKQYNND